MLHASKDQRAAPASECEGFATVRRRLLPRRSDLRLLVAILGVLGLAVAGGCANMPPPGSGSQGGETTASWDELQSAAMSFADRYVSIIADACDRSVELAKSPEQTLWLQRYKADTALAAFTIASGPSSSVAVLDLTSVVTLRRMLLDEYWVNQFPPGTIEPLLTASRAADKDVWKLVGGLMSSQQLTDLRSLIDQWRKDNPDQRHVASVRFSNFDTYRNRAAELHPQGPGSIFSLLYIDPFPNLDPTVRGIAQIRELVEREAYFFERLPLILDYQAALFVERTAALPEVRTALNDASRFSAAAERFSSVTEHFAADVGAQGHELVNQIDAKLTEERKAALDHLSEILTQQQAQMAAEISRTLDRQREALFSDIDVRDKQARELLAEVRATADRLENLSKSVHGTVDAIDRLSQPAPLKPGETPSRPFDVREYGDAAERIAIAARDTTGLMNSIGATFNSTPKTPVDQTLYGEAAARLDVSISHVIDLAFTRALILILVLLAGAGAIVFYARRPRAKTAVG